jgi:methane monooxygenase PmoA-like
LVLDLEFSAKEPTLIGKSNFGFVGVRMAKTIGVHDGGGTIRNSAGGVDEKGVHEKPARWCDYSGPITREAREGITLLDHPSNSNHPTVFHVRDDGWMGAAFTFAAPYTLRPGTPLTLRYGLWVHAGVPAPEQIDRQFEAFAKMGGPPAPKR